MFGARNMRPPRLGPAAALFGGRPPLVSAPGRQTIGMSLKEANSSTTDGTAFNTVGSIAFAVNTLALVSLSRTGAADDAVAPVLTSTGRTWAAIDSQKLSAINHRVWLFWSYAAGGTNATINFTFTGTAQSVVWNVVEATGVDAGSPIVQSNKGAPVGNQTTVSATLAALEHGANAMFAAFQLNNLTTITPDADFTEVGDDSVGTVNQTLESEWALGQTQCDPTFTSSVVGWVAAEIRAAAA